MENKVILNPTELTGIMGKGEMIKLSNEVGEKKWKEYRDKYDLASNLKQIDYPIQLDFELNASCNMRCPMCPISAESPKGKGKKTWFDFEFFKEILEYSVKKGTQAIKLNYINEPLIRNDFIKFIHFAKKIGILDIYFSTNGMLLNEDISKELINSGLTRIQISIDAITEETYDKVRPGGDYKKILSNVLSFIELKKKLNSNLPLTRVNFVKTEINHKELNKFIEFWKDKVDMIGVQEFIKPTKVKKEIDGNNEKRKTGFKCSFPFKQLVINNERKVLPCCTFWGEELELQTINKPEDLLEAWNSKKMKFLRKKHIEGKYYEGPQCNKCING